MPSDPEGYDEFPAVGPWWRRNLPLLAVGGAMAALLAAAMLFGWG